MTQVDQMIEVNIKESDDFLKIKETLTRIGVAHVKTKHYFSLVTFYINNRKYYIVHFKELFALDACLQIFQIMILLEEIQLQIF